MTGPTRSLFCMLLFPALAAAGLCQAAELPDAVGFLRQPQLLVPHADHAFTIDGTVSDAERAASAAIDGFLSFDTDAVGVDGCTAWLAHTGEALYVAFAFDRPAGAPPVATAAERDDIALWKLDDAAELMLTVGNTTWDFIGNSAGVRGDYIHRPQNWDFHSEAWRYAARVTDAGWEGEFLIPAEVLGLDAFGPEVEARFDLVSNAKSLSMSLLSYRGGHWHANMQYWPGLRFGAPGEAYQTAQSVGDLGDGKIGLQATIANPSRQPREIDAWVAFYRAPDEESISWFSEVGGLYQTEGIALLPGATDDELIRLLAGGALDRHVQAGQVAETLTVPAAGGVDVDLWRHSFTGGYLVAHLFRDAATGAVLSGGVYPFAVAPPLRTEVHYYYLTTQRIYALTLVPSDPRISALRYQVFAAEGGGQPLAEEIAVDLQPGARTKIPISSAGWPAGDYRLQVEALDAGGGVLQTNAVDFTKPPTPEWFGSDAGRQIAVSWPWTPVQARESAVEMWGRRYEFGDGPLPARIISQGEEILTGPARLSVSVGGGDSPWTGGGASLESADEAAAVYRARANASGLSLDARTTVEFDGMMRFDLTLSAEQPVTVDRLFLEVPVAPQVARMFSTYSFGLMPANARPAEWEQLPFAGAIPDEPLALPFTPSLVLRNDHVGIEWFAEWDMGWANADRARVIEIVPGEDEVLLRVRLIDAPTQLSGERTITFGLEAWPVKPWPDREPHLSNYLINERQNTENWTLEEQLRRAIDLGMTAYWWFHWNAFTTETGAKHPPEYPMLPPTEKREEIIEAARITQSLGIPIIGHCGYALPPTTPVFEYYGREMAVHPLNNKGAWGYLFTADSPFPDAWVHGFRELARQYGWSGVQLDGAFSPRYNEAEETGSAQRDERGRLHGKYPIFAYRDFARRLYNVYHGEVDFPGIEHGFIHCHLGSHAIGPIHAFSDAIHSGESTRTMRVPHLAEIDLDLERAVYAGGALGVPRTWLPKLGKAPHGPQGRIATALQMDLIPDHNRILTWAQRNDYDPKSYPAHRVWAAREWIDARPETFVWHNESERYATAGGGDAYLSLHLRPGQKALLALSNWSADEREVPLTLRSAAMGFAGVALQAEDAITGEPVPLDGDTMTLTVRGDSYRLIKLFPREAQ